MIMDDNLASVLSLKDISGSSVKKNYQFIIREPLR